MMHEAVDHAIEVPVLIVGAGPAGASLACFLSHPPYGLKGLLVSAAPTTSQTPRAHIVNPAALECLRDIGLEEACMQAGTSGDSMLHTRWCHDMSGEEYARIYSWGNDPKRRGEYEDATPCKHIDLPQSVLEPILVQRAASEGWDVRFSVTFERFEENKGGDGVTSFLRDNVTNTAFVVRSRYLFGCDGARSTIAHQLDLPLILKPGQGLALNVLVKVDLSDSIEARKGNLHWVFQPENPYPDFAWASIVRMVKPWNEWMFILFPRNGVEFKMPSHEQLLERCREIAGKSDISIEILDVSKWHINEIVAQYYAKGHVFCLGDAVHRHPPFNGLGSNTCIQDAFNVAWKTKLVMHGISAPDLMGTYSEERQPVGHGVVTRANQGIRDHLPVWKELGLLEETPEQRIQSMNVLSEATPEGTARRARLSNALESTSHEFHGLGIEMNHRYTSAAVVTSEYENSSQPPLMPDDPILYHRPSTWPGSRLPHAWLNTRIPQKTHTSTLDLAGHGVFCILTGIGGDGWRDAAVHAGQKFGIEIRVYSIGWRQDYEDVYRDWERKREVAENGCVLIRPDRYITWRSMSVSEDSASKLEDALGRILSRSMQYPR